MRGETEHICGDGHCTKDDCMAHEKLGSGRTECVVHRLCVYLSKVCAVKARFMGTFYIDRLSRPDDCPTVSGNMDEMVFSLTVARDDPRSRWEIKKKLLKYAIDLFAAYDNAVKGLEQSMHKKRSKDDRRDNLQV